MKARGPGTGLKACFRPTSAAEVGFRAGGNRFLTAAAGFGGYGRQDRTIHRIQVDGRWCQHSVHWTDLTAETAAGAFMGQQSHVKPPGSRGAGGAEQGSGGAHTRADSAGCAGIRKAGEHPAKI